MLYGISDVYVLMHVLLLFFLFRGHQEGKDIHSFNKAAV